LFEFFPAVWFVVGDSFSFFSNFYDKLLDKGRFVVDALDSVLLRSYAFVGEA
jgi:hypothetical protein